MHLVHRIKTSSRWEVVATMLWLESWVFTWHWDNLFMSSCFWQLALHSAKTKVDYFLEHSQKLNLLFSYPKYEIVLPEHLSLRSAPLKISKVLCFFFITSGNFLSCPAAGEQPLWAFSSYHNIVLFLSKRLSCCVADPEQDTLLLFMVTGKHLKMKTKHTLKAQMPKGRLYF